MFISCSFALFSRFVKLSSDGVRQVSSANKVVVNFEHFGKSLTYIKKSKGPRDYPGGMPHVTF